MALNLGDSSLFMECAAMATRSSSPVENANKKFPEHVRIVFLIIKTSTIGQKQ